MFFFKNKTITNRQTLVIGFVLAVLSMASMAVISFALPYFGALLNMNGVTELDFFYTAFMVVFLLAIQGLLLFGFPLYYAQDQKSHMTGFRILLSTFMWMILIMLFTGLVFVRMHKAQNDSLDQYLQQGQEQQAPTDSSDTTVAPSTDATGAATTTPSAQK